MRARPHLAIALGTGGLALVLASALETLGERDGAITSYGSISPGAAVLETLTGAALVAAATVLATDSRRRKGALGTFFLGLTWMVGDWAGWSDAPGLARNLGLLLLPMVAPATLLVVATLVTERRLRVLGFSVAGVAIAAGTAAWLVREPFDDRYCWRDCLADSLAPFAEVDRARTLTNVTLALGAACGILVVVAGVAGLRARNPGDRANGWALVPAIAAGAAIAISSAALLLEPAESPERALYAGLFVARAAALTLFAGGMVAAVVLRRRVVRAEIEHLAGNAPGSPGGALVDALARAFDDPGLRIGYPLSDGSIVDADGRPTELGDTATRILRGGALVALVGSSSGEIPVAALNRELGPAGRLALANERLRAEQLARLRELTDLRRRIVATGDAARERLERDLHDGAQQRLLAVVFDLRVAVGRAEAAGDDTAGAALRAALERVSSAAAELRDIAHGIFPAVLATSGLAAAVETLADSRPLTLALQLDHSQRYPPAVETAAYAVVSEGTAHASAPIRVEIREAAESLVVTVDGALWERAVVSLEDRVGAADGAITCSGRRLEARLPVPAPD